MQPGRIWAMQPGSIWAMQPGSTWAMQPTGYKQCGRWHVDKGLRVPTGHTPQMKYATAELTPHPTATPAGLKLK